LSAEALAEASADTGRTAQAASRPTAPPTILPSFAPDVIPRLKFKHTQFTAHVNKEYRQLRFAGARLLPVECS
jgi:hypothetical protein